MTKSKADQAAPKTTEAAIVLLERFGRNAGVLATIEANRRTALTSTNAVADDLAAPLLADQAELLAKLEPWWAKNADTLTKGARKSIELGGCMIGTQSGRASLGHTLLSDTVAVAALQAAGRWAKPYVRVTYAIDRVATMKALEGSHAAKLGALGFKKNPGATTFYVERVAQDGVVAA